MVLGDRGDLPDITYRRTKLNKLSYFVLSGKNFFQLCIKQLIAFYDDMSVGFFHDSLSAKIINNPFV